MTAQAIWDVPDVGEELNRKVLETLDYLEKKKSSGEILERDFCVALLTLNQVALGLYDRDLAEWVSTYLSENGRVLKPITARRVFAAPAATFVVEYETGSAELRIFRVQDGAVKLLKHLDSSDQIDGIRIAHSKYVRTVRELSDKYTEVR